MSETPDGRRVSVGTLAAVGLAGAAAVAGWRMLRRGAADHGLSFRGRALITGASSGIGEAFARRLAAEGCNLILVARRADRLQALADELSGAHGIHVEVLPANLALDEDVERVAQAITAAPDLTLLVNNAGFGTRGDFAEVTLDRHLDMIHVHVIATVALTKAALPAMIAAGRGAIINVSSIAAFFPSGGGATYTATKAYLNNFSEAVAAELKDSGVKVQALCPGFTYSGFHDTSDYRDFDRKQIPDALWMPAEAVVDASLASLAGDKVIVVPGRQYRAMVATINSPFRGAIRGAARSIRGRWHSIHKPASGAHDTITDSTEPTP